MSLKSECSSSELLANEPLLVFADFTFNGVAALSFLLGFNF